MKMNRHTFVTVGILVGLVLGFAVGQYFFSFADEATRLKAVDIFDFLGTTFFMNLLKMMLVPLVASSVIVGVASIGDPSSLGRIGSITILYYFATMVIAVVLGLALVTSIRPGKGIDPATREKGEEAYSEVDDKKRGAIEERGAGGLFGGFQEYCQPDDSLQSDWRCRRRENSTGDYGQHVAGNCPHRYRSGR